MATELTEKVKAAFPTLTFRTVEEIGSLFAGLELLDPGVVRLAEWHAPTEPSAEDEQLAMPATSSTAASPAKREPAVRQRLAR